jgi:hypothetical protein
MFECGVESFSNYLFQIYKTLVTSFRVADVESSGSLCRFIFSNYIKILNHSVGLDHSKHVSRQVLFVEHIIDLLDNSILKSEQNSNLMIQFPLNGYLLSLL